MPEIKNGSILLDRYLVDKLLGVGGSSAVYLVFDQILNRQVAIKFLHQWSTHSGSQIPLMRFEREAQSLSQLLHPNIIRVFRFGVLDNNEAFLVMEYTQGETLRAYLERKKVLSCSEAMGIALQICAALEYAHSAQMVHRDLKPENVMVVESAYDTTIKVLDFGLCKFVSDAEQVADLIVDSEATMGFTLTETGLLIGTAAYMSPEQGMGEPADYRSDIYSFGCVLFEMITGSPPFPGDAPGAILLKHMSEPTPKILTLAPDSGFPPLLQEVILKCTAKNKKDRYQSFVDLSKDLLAIDQMNCPGVFKLKPAAPLGLNRRIIIAAVSVLLSVIAAAAFFLFATDEGKLIQAGQIQESQSAASASRALLEMHRKFLKEHKVELAKKLVENSLNANIFHNWPSSAKSHLLLGYVESYKDAGLKDEQFESSVHFLESTLDSVRHEFLRGDPPAEEAADLGKLTREMYDQKLSRKQWARISKVFDTRSDAMTKHHIVPILLWPGVLRCKAQVSAGAIQTPDARTLLAENYLFATRVAHSAKEKDLMFAMANKGIELTKAHDLPYVEHFLHSELCHYYIETNQLDKARFELAELERASKELVLSGAETGNRNELRQKLGVGKVEKFNDETPWGPGRHPVFKRFMGDK